MCRGAQFRQLHARILLRTQKSQLRHSCVAPNLRSSGECTVVLCFGASTMRASCLIAAASCASRSRRLLRNVSKSCLRLSKSACDWHGGALSPRPATCSPGIFVCEHLPRSPPHGQTRSLPRNPWCHKIGQRSYYSQKYYCRCVQAGVQAGEGLQGGGHKLLLGAS